jgi:hypothetical protein
MNDGYYEVHLSYEKESSPAFGAAARSYSLMNTETRQFDAYNKDR